MSQDSQQVELAKIQSLSFYKDKLTTARRTSPLPQLICHGKPCKAYRPEVVTCTSLPGATGTNVDWRCEAELPESLRFGKLEVGCEGWSRPGDSYVLEGSCSLDYELIRVPSSLRTRNDPFFGPLQNLHWTSIVFYAFCIGTLVYILYRIISACCPDGWDANPPRRPRRENGHPVGDNHDPPPPYRREPDDHIGAARSNRDTDSAGTTALTTRRADNAGTATPSGRSDNNVTARTHSSANNIRTRRTSDTQVSSETTRSAFGFGASSVR